MVNNASDRHEPTCRLQSPSATYDAPVLGAHIDITYTEDEIIYIDVDGHRFTFEIGSDDDEYVFTDGSMTFTIPIMDFDEDF